MMDGGQLDRGPFDTVLQKVRRDHRLCPRATFRTIREIFAQSSAVERLASGRDCVSIAARRHGVLPDKARTRTRASSVPLQCFCKFVSGTLLSIKR